MAVQSNAPRSGDQDDRDREFESDSSEADADDKSPAPPTVIGWLLRGISLLLIGSLLVYLVAKALGPTSEFRLAIAPQWAEASTRDGEMLVPIDITNDSSQTVRNLSFEVQPVGRDPIEIEIALFGPGEKFTYVVNIAQQSEPLAHRVLHFEK